jgi:hypothetical protein
MDQLNQEAAKQPKDVNNKPLVVLCCVLLAAIVAVGAGIGVLLSGGAELGILPEQTFPGEPLKELKIDAVQEQGNQVLVQTSYGTVCFPFAFSDVIQAEAKNLGGATALCFYAKIDRDTHKLLTLWFNRDEYIPIGTLLVDGKEVSVTAELFEAPFGLEQGERNTFLAAQECFNEMVASLYEMEGFTPAQ